MGTGSATGRSANAVLPLQSCLRHAALAGLTGEGREPVVLLPRRRRGRAYEFDERRFLTREQLARLLAEVPDGWRPLFELLASTGLRISEAIALRVVDVDCGTPAPLCSSTPAPTRYGCNAGWAITPPRSHSTTTATSSTTASAPTSAWAPTDPPSVEPSPARSAARRAVDLAHLGRARRDELGGRPRLLGVAVLVAFGAIGWSAAIWRTRRRFIR
jgi:hypothetical protein